MTQIETTMSADVRLWQHCAVARKKAVGRWVPTELVSETDLSRVFRARVCREGTVNYEDRSEFNGDINDGRPAGYALKVLRECRENDAGAIAVMRREVQAARSVCHPRVIPVLAAGLRRPPYYIVTPWLHGRTLADRLAEPVELDLPVILWIVRQVAEALEGMFDAGWTHGDIKPDNVFISPEGHVTLLDLGFARPLRNHEAGRPVALDWQYFTGTGSYLAPESLTTQSPPDIRSDIYSLGVMFFEMLTGRLPFDADDVATVLAQHRQSRPPNPRRFDPNIPVEAIRLLQQILAKHPLRRPQTPRELIDRLVQLEIRFFAERTTCGVFELAQ